MGVLGVLVLLGLVAVWRWGAHDIAPPWSNDETWPVGAAEGARRAFWYGTVAVTSGVVAGVVMFGAGGRLAMRLLAVTAGDAAQGRITEADQVVGQITFGGTMSFIGFFGVLIGTFLGFVYLAVRRWLPRGRLGGLVFGLILLAVAATRADPLRPDNKDFDIVGPGWVSVLVFSVVVVGYGLLVAAVAGRYSRALPSINRDWRTIARYAPAYVIWGPAAVVLAVPVGLMSLTGAVLGKTEGLDRIARAPGPLIAGRILGAVLFLVALPGFISGVTDIISRS